MVSQVVDMQRNERECHELALGDDAINAVNLRPDPPCSRHAFAS